MKWSKAQKDYRKHFKKGIADIRAAQSDPKVHAKYERKARKLDKPAWNLASSDYFKGKDLYVKR